jgi:hypothetical protein
MFCNTFLISSGGDKEGLKMMEATCAVCGKKSCNHRVSHCLAARLGRPCGLPSDSAICNDCSDEHRLTHLPLPPSEGHNYKHGWLSPTGEFYHCGYRDHDTLAALLEDTTGQYLYRKGWISLNSGLFVVDEYYRPDDKVTQQQFDFITGWLFANNEIFNHPERFEIR